MSKLSANELSIVTNESELLAGFIGSLDLEGFLDGDVVARPMVR